MTHIKTKAGSANFAIRASGSAIQHGISHKYTNYAFQKQDGARGADRPCFLSAIVEIFIGTMSKPRSTPAGTQRQFYL
jgi:hypothetical protein